MTAIKWGSTILITGAIGLELWHLGAVLAQSQIPSFLQPIFWVERVAVGIHLIEAVIAALYAKRKHKAAIPTGIYTFFVGSVGLVELFTANQTVDQITVNQTVDPAGVELTPLSDGSIAPQEGEC